MPQQLKKNLTKRSTREREDVDRKRRRPFKSLKGSQHRIRNDDDPKGGKRKRARGRRTGGKATKIGRKTETKRKQIRGKTTPRWQVKHTHVRNGTQRKRVKKKRTKKTHPRRNPTRKRRQNDDNVNGPPLNEEIDEGDDQSEGGKGIQHTRRGGLSKNIRARGGRNGREREKGKNTTGRIPKSV